MKKIFIFLSIFFLILSCSSTKPKKNKLGKIWSSERFGEIDNRKKLDSIMTNTIEGNIDSEKPLVIVYYPGKDRCNSSGTSTRNSTEIWYNEMEDCIREVCESNIIYIYKDSTGLYGRHDGYKQWYKDPKGIIEQLFFQEKTVCNGYVLISKNGKYISGLSEFDKYHLCKRLNYLCKEYQN
jgi:hypothetical protein